mmetsp:Transcript_8203/g.15496  ORF Transcript_8203/g.15496 Transcript_8203/m.15496 type:complete len:289 (-) Transcript_8203:49-915(-)
MSSYQPVWRTKSWESMPEERIDFVVHELRNQPPSTHGSGHLGKWAAATGFMAVTVIGALAFAGRLGSSKPYLRHPSADDLLGMVELSPVLIQCADEGQNCFRAGCCKRGGHKCYMKDASEAFCKASSPAGWLGHEIARYEAVDQGSGESGGTESRTGDGNTETGNGSDDEATVGAECCTSSLPHSTGHPCDFCFTGAAVSVGWCAQSKDTCQSDCGGTWCPNGATNPYMLYDAKSVTAAVMPVKGSWSSALTISMSVSLLLFGLLAVAYWWHRSKGAQQLCYEPVSIA